MRIASRLAILSMLFFGATSTEAAQAGGGQIQGNVMDAAGVPLAGVTVTITHTPTGHVREVVTDARGFFAAPSLPLGDHEVQAVAPGYAARRQTGVVVQTGRVITLRLELTSAPAPETITVAGWPPVVDASRPAVATALEPGEVQHLPLRDRNALGLAPLAAGTSVGPDTTIAVGGGTGAFNRILVDGAEPSWSADGPWWMSAEAAHDVRVNTNAYPADHGRATAGIIEAGIRSGSNQLAGSAFAFRGGAAPDGSTNQFGGSVGGPLVRDRHFAFGVVDGWRVTADNPVSLNVPDGTPDDAATREGIARLRTFTDTWERTQDRTLVLAKTDHSLADVHRLGMRYEHGRVTALGSDRPDAARSHDAAASIERSSHELTASATAAIGSTLVNEARAHVGRSRWSGPTNGDGPMAVVRQHGADILSIGSDPLGSRAATLTRVGLANALTWQIGGHELRSGADVQLDRIHALVPALFRGAYEFNSLASFGRGAPTAPADAYIQAFEGAGSSGREVRPNIAEYSLFVQDAWRFTRELTLHAGLRYDAQTFAGPEVIRSDGDNLAPRVGAAWAPLDDRIVVRAAYGIVYGRTPWPMVAAAQAHNGINVQTIAFRPGRDRLPAFPERFETPPRSTSSRAAVVTFAGDFDTPRVQQAGGGFEWEWMPNTAVAAHYVTARGDRLPRPVERGDPAGRIISYESTGRSRYDMLMVELTRRLAQGHQYRVSYTLGRARDSLTGGIALAPETRDDRWIAPAAEPPVLSAARTDYRHRLAAGVIYQSNRIADRFHGFTESLIEDWTLSAVYSAQSGLPFTAYVNGDLNRDGNRYNDLAPGTGRNANRLPAWVSVDARIARDFAIKGDTQITLLWEAFNLFDKLNHLSVNDTQFDLRGSELIANPFFGEGLLRIGPRTMHLAARVSF